MAIQILGLKIIKCPRCQGDLLNTTYQEDEREKECPSCDLIFKKKRGKWNRWRMGTAEEFIEDEINF